MSSLGYKYEYNSPVHPKKFALWLGLGAIVMSFAGLTSAYIVKKGAGYWVEFNLPSAFLMSTVLVIVSSLTMQLAFWANKNLKVDLAKLALLSTFVLGIGFLASQIMAAQSLDATGIKLNGNPSGSFVYIIAGLHFAHIVGGLVAMFVAIVNLFWRNRNSVKSMLDEINPERNTGLYLLTTYWHFVGILWLYLYLFFKFY